MKNAAKIVASILAPAVLFSMLVPQQPLSMLLSGLGTLLLLIAFYKGGAE